MAPELETLDQLLGGDLPLEVVAGRYADEARFARGLTGLLRSGAVRLVGADGGESQEWQWREVLAAPSAMPGVRVRITPTGARRIE